MTTGHALVLRRSIYIWIGTFAIIAFTLFAAGQPTLTLTYAALMATGAFAIIGIGFGIWAGLTVTRRF